MHQCANHPLPERYGRAFLIGILLNSAFVAVEGAYGYAIDSLALLADAGHNLSDVLGLIMAWSGYALAKLPPTPRHTYGWRSSTILAALFNSLLLIFAVCGIAWEAFDRLWQPERIDSYTVITVALIGVVINTGTALLFARGRKTDLNLRGAYLHMAADALLSLGVVIAGVIIHYTGYLWIDPMISLVIATVIFAGTWNLFRESLWLTLQSVPQDLDAQQIHTDLLAFAGVKEVHDLHIWAISTTETCLTAHLEVPKECNHDQLLKQIQSTLHDRYGICNTTIQIEQSKSAVNCGQSSID
ncbi:cation diffusion facilitator family transporter [Rhodopirellula sp.]|jgi:cobalt-zinc-cadmium efflux system protein|nr:cation diffusion facilitator family transporter [Rhodopirellula sp.]